MRPIVLAIWQSDPGCDPRPALASIQATERYVVGAPGLTGTVPQGAQVLSVACPDRASVAKVIQRAHPGAAVIVVGANERPSSDLAAALERLRADDASGEYRARSAVQFLGREIRNGTVALAWVGSPGECRVRHRLSGTLTVIAEDVSTSIVKLDEAASRAAAVSGSTRVGDFLWRPVTRLVWRMVTRARDGVPGFILSVLETYGEVVTAAKTWERRLNAKTQRRGRTQPNAEFERIDTHIGWMLVREDLDQELLEKFAGATPNTVDGERLTGRGRGGVWLLRATSGQQAILRWYRRGGVFRRVLRDRYFGWRPRPVCELELTEAARRRGVPTPEVLGARIDRLGGGFYRGALLSRRIDDASTLGDLLASRLGGRERVEVLSAVGTRLRALHDLGVHHRDLNVSNVLVGELNGRYVVSLIDFDRAALRRSVPGWLRRRALRRLKRSFVKLDYGADLTEDDFRVLWRAYRILGARETKG